MLRLIQFSFLAFLVLNLISRSHQPNPASASSLQIANRKPANKCNRNQAYSRGRVENEIVLKKTNAGEKKYRFEDLADVSRLSRNVFFSLEGKIPQPPGPLLAIHPII